MKLLCHRGCWETLDDQNSIASLLRAMRQGFGVETDIRDCNGDLVIAHDIPIAGHVAPLVQLLESYIELESRPLLALNIKSDGLSGHIRSLLGRYKVDKYFMFDMSVPDTISYLKKKMAVAVRVSEYESGQWMLDHADTIWLDAFENDWYDRELILSFLEANKRLCVVSPELHGRSHEAVWDLLKSVPTPLAQELYLCTDLVAQAIEVFDVARD